MKKIITLLIIGLLSSQLFADAWSDMRKPTPTKTKVKDNNKTKSSTYDRFKKSDKKNKKEVKKKERKPLW